MTRTGIAPWTCRPSCGVLGRVRAVGLPDLLVAAVAEREHVTVLHYDANYDLIAEVTRQSVRWIVPRGAVPETADKTGAVVPRDAGDLASGPGM
jgi:hypothetical protein